MTLLIFLGFLLAFSGIALIIYLATQRRDRTADLEAADRAELDLTRDVLVAIEDLAFNQRDINPELSVQVRDEIRKHRDRVNKSRREIEKRN